MKDYILKDEWNIIEKGFNPEYNRISESIFSIGNGHMGQRANFEEGYSGDSGGSTPRGGLLFVGDHEFVYLVLREGPAPGVHEFKVSLLEGYVEDGHNLPYDGTPVPVYG